MALQAGRLEEAIGLLNSAAGAYASGASGAGGRADRVPDRRSAQAVWGGPGEAAERVTSRARHAPRSGRRRGGYRTVERDPQPRARVHRRLRAHRGCGRGGADGRRGARAARRARRSTQQQSDPVQTRTGRRRPATCTPRRSTSPSDTSSAIRSLARAATSGTSACAGICPTRASTRRPGSPEAAAAATGTARASARAT